jgi:formylglycine-generating enzyme required for sulfatase activity
VAPPGTGGVDRECLDVIKHFVDARLLVSDRDDQDRVTIEIIHEALFRKWVQFRQWLSDDRPFLEWRQRLEERVQAWVDTSPDDLSRRDPAQLLEGRELAEAAARLKTRRTDMGREMRAYLDAGTFRRDRRRLTSIAAVAAIALALFAGKWGVDWWNQRDRTLRTIDQLLDSDSEATPGILAKLETDRKRANRRLHTMLQTRSRAGSSAPLSEDQLDRIRVFLLPADPWLLDLLRDHLLDERKRPGEMLALLESLGSPPLKPGPPNWERRFLRSLWSTLRTAQDRPPRRLRAAVALARYDAASPQWGAAGKAVIDLLLTADSAERETLVVALESVKLSLIAPLEELFRDPNSNRRRLAASILANLELSDPDALVEFLPNADPEQFRILIQKLNGQDQRLVNRLLAVLMESVAPRWDYPPLDPALASPDPVDSDRIVRADGLLGPHFGLCQTMPLDEFVALADRLRGAGYRPVRFRPYRVASDGPPRVAAVWTRDGRDWRMAHGLKAEQVRDRDARASHDGYLPVDVAAYPSPSPEEATELYSALWVKTGAHDDPAEMFVDRSEGEHNAAFQPLRDRGYVPRTYTFRFGPGGAKRYSEIWVKPKAPPALQSFPYALEPTYEVDLMDDTLQTDLSIQRTIDSPPARDQNQRQLARAEQTLKDRPRDQEARFLRDQAYIQLDQLKAATKDQVKIAADDLAALVAEAPDTVKYHQYRCFAEGRLGREAEARAALEKLRALNPDRIVLFDTTAGTLIFLGEYDEAFRMVEAKVQENDTEHRYLYWAANDYARAVSQVAGRDPVRARSYAERAAQLLERAFANGWTQYDNLLVNSNFESLRHDPAVAAIIARGHPRRGYSAIWHGSSQLQSRELHGLPPAEHLRRCEGLVAQGYQPVAIAVGPDGASQEIVAGSVWHLPAVPEASRDVLARRQAKAAMALLLLRDPGPVLERLHHNDDPRTRTELIHLLGPLGVEPGVVIGHWRAAKDASVRRALILSLGDYAEADLPANDRASLLAELVESYRSDPDPGVHSSIDWLLRQWNQGDRLSAIDRDLAGQPARDHLWLVNNQRQTFALIRGPVEFLMGSPGTEEGRDSDERRHLRRIDRSYAIATREVTLEEFRRFKPDQDMERRYYDGTQSPASDFTYYQAARYCRWLSEQEGTSDADMCYPPIPEIKPGMKLPADYLSRTGYRLPTEAEWEYACRAGTITPRHYGSSLDLLERYGWFQERSQDKLHPVGLLKPNEFGLFDVHGNVSEWCDKSYYPYTFDKPLGSDVIHDLPDTTEWADKQRRICRGGSFSDGAIWLRSAYRNSDSTITMDYSDVTIGLRVARTVRPQ